MKPFYIICVFFFVSLHLYAQSDSIKTKPGRALTFHLSTGINILQSEQLRTGYGTKALHFWGAGIRIGQPGNDLVFFGVDYNASSYRISREINNRSIDSLLILNQLIPSLSLKLLEGKDFMLRARTGFIYCILTDQLHQMEDNSDKGFKIGLGLERKIGRNQWVHFDIDYDLMKPTGNDFRDYDVVKLGIGIYL
ncbi:hypothetical protein GXP67_21195 [Rhodocytophaga rosea]|uniref:Outer membrane protein beta-barrel domain-containing protein n=1 Tax=Rhodocytophaga rosea TaxID=2704465 RepID=A0A6C0GM18_9BACT|nr:hypothetical protein [Rhodocytophaga rosea]QHT68987.1 hypothetical protein GXP67_21195 [Rhodocytophaga rosea]